MRIGLRTPVHVGLVGDSRPALKSLLAVLPRNDDRGFLEAAQRSARDWWELMEERGSQEDVPMKPQVVAWQLSQALADDAIISGDSGTIAIWAGQMLRIKKGQRFSLSGNLVDGQRIALCDRGPAVTPGPAVRRLRRRRRAGDADGGFRHLRPVPPAGGAQLAEALKTEGPVIVEAVTDPFEPPLPPKIQPRQAVHMAESLARGEPNRERIAVTMFRNSVDEAAYPASSFGVLARIMRSIFGRRRKPEVSS